MYLSIKTLKLFQKQRLVFKREFPYFILSIVVMNLNFFFHVDHNSRKQTAIFCFLALEWMQQYTLLNNLPVNALSELIFIYPLVPLTVYIDHK